MHKARIGGMYCLALLLASCGGEESQQLNTSSSAAANTSAPTPTPTPSPTPTSSTDQGSQSTAGGGTTLASSQIVESGLDVASLLGPKSIPSSNEPDRLGAFRFLCAPSHLAYDDPIVFPGEPGRSHLHQFFGNRSADANSTYASLRQSGESTCMNELNRSSYWMPALLDGKGNVIRPNHIAVYYKRRPTSDSYFEETGTTPVILPRGLRYIFGWDSNRASEQQPENDKHFQWKCIDVWTPVNAPGDTMDDALSVCSPGKKLAVSIASSPCWDGKNLDSPDHRSHMSDTVSDASTDWVNRCPDSHPYVVTEFIMTVEWTIGAEDDMSLFKLASDHMLPAGAPRGSSMHADWIGAWEDTILERWHAACIDKLLNCSDGDLGDGNIMMRNEHYPSKPASPRLAPIPPRVI